MKTMNKVAALNNPNIHQNRANNLCHFLFVVEINSQGLHLDETGILTSRLRCENVFLNIIITRVKTTKREINISMIAKTKAYIYSDIIFMENSLLNLLYNKQLTFHVNPHHSHYKNGGLTRNKEIHCHKARRSTERNA